MLKKFILRVRELDELSFLRNFGQILLVDDLINMVIIETDEKNLQLIKKHPNVIQVQESRRGILLGTL